MDEGLDRPGFRQRRKDPEYQQVLVRFAFLVFGMTYLGLGVYSRYYPIAAYEYYLFATGFFVYSIATYWHVTRYPGIQYRPYVTLFLDITSVTIGISMTGGAGSPFYLLYIWIFLSHSIRFGRSLLYTASVLSLIGFGIVLAREDNWSQQTFEAVFFVICLLVLPVYIDVMLKKLTKAKREADEANRAKSIFLANMSHELRTPLNAIIGYSELMHEEAVENGSTEIMTDLEKINSAGRHLLSLISSILDFSKIEAGKIDMELMQVNVRELVASVVTTIQGIMQKTRNSFDVKYVNNPGMMYIDAVKLKQILLNLLGNAAKFTQNGKIVLEIESFLNDERSHIEFRVRDTGVGIPADQVARLFEPFAQADASTTREFGGTGLGLAISQSYCNIMGGTIRVDSEVGKGTTFTVDLPWQADRREKTFAPVVATK